MSLTFIFMPPGIMMSPAFCSALQAPSHLASIVVVLIWIYYSAQIVLFGAEFTHVRAEQRSQIDRDD